MLSDFNNALVVFVLISMACFLGWLILDNRKNKKAGKHELILPEDEWRWLE